ncbi:hypothetical protein AMJ50_02165 [Parcubacteria bacterium DG_74_3]|nr:MAG: hypothetical protein AMJ50_02165 [Parcubacteria bacterium DG_74_3]
MKLKDFLETVHGLSEKVGQMRMGVSSCPDCKGQITQEEHKEKHLEEAMRIRDKLPHNLVWSFKNLEIIPKITMTFDGKGHAVASLEEVEIY